MAGGPDIPFFWSAFAWYLAATVAAAVYVGVRKPAIRLLVFWLTVLGLVANTFGLVIRSVLSAHPPVTNLFEYM